MCIIVVKPKGVEFPSWETLKRCFDGNPDGAGIMWNGEDGKVHIEKGFMEYGTFRKALKRIKKEVTDNTSVVMHFRIKTHGEVSRECCHPFPVEGKLNMLRETEFISDFGVAHNGVLANRDTNNKKSDSMDYILQVLYPLKSMCKGWMHDKYAHSVVGGTIQSSRLAIMDGTGDVVTFGKFYDENGVMYSNTSYKPFDYSMYWGKKFDETANKPSATITRKQQEVDEFVEDEMWDDDPWNEDYISGEVLDEFYNSCPCERVCFDVCPDYDACACSYSWFCGSEDEAVDYVLQFNHVYEM